MRTLLTSPVDPLGSNTIDHVRAFDHVKSAEVLILESLPHKFSDRQQILGIHRSKTDFNKRHSPCTLSPPLGVIIRSNAGIIQMVSNGAITPGTLSHAIRTLHTHQNTHADRNPQFCLATSCERSRQEW
jgi:hypothetical protein